MACEACVDCTEFLDADHLLICLTCHDPLCDACSSLGSVSCECEGCRAANRSEPYATEAQHGLFSGKTRGP